MRLLYKISAFFERNSHLQYVIIALVGVIIFGWLQAPNSFADPDSFYHAGAAKLLVEQGAVTSFPWLSATTLAASFADHHFLYHLVLIPFVMVFDPLTGLKIATMVFATSVGLTALWLLRRLQVPGAFWYVLFLFTINPFLFRVNLAKAQGLVLCALLVFIYFLFTHKRLWLIFLSALYTWLYAGWPLLLVIAFCYLVAQLASGQDRLANAYKAFLTLLAVAGGLVLGLLLNPYMPHHFYFFYQQIVEIAVVGYRNSIGVGGEWYPLDPGVLLAGAPFFVALFAVGIAAFLIGFKKQTPRAVTFLLIAVLFLVLTLRSRRHIEYFIPFGVLFSALSLTNFWRSIADEFTNRWQKTTPLFIAPLLFVIVSPWFYMSYQEVYRDNLGGYSLTMFAKSANWLKENTPAKSIVFHSDWDEFPVLWYYNRHNYYLVGLDPTFMYRHDEQLYWRWVKATTGQAEAELTQTVDLFGATYVFVDFPSHQALDEQLRRSADFTLVYSDDQAHIYQRQ